MARDATLLRVFQKAKHLYFDDIEVDAESMCLADSGGVLIPVEDKANWSLSKFYNKSPTYNRGWSGGKVSVYKSLQETTSDNEKTNPGETSKLGDSFHNMFMVAFSIICVYGNGGTAIP